MSYLLSNGSKHNYEDAKKAPAIKIVETVDVSGSDWPSKLADAIDNLAENRTSIREEALQLITRILLCHNASAEIENRLDDLLGLIKKSITKYGSTKESTLASRLLALVFITLGYISSDEDNTLFKRISSTLKSTAENAEELDIKISCLQTLTVITYIAAEDRSTKSVRDYLFDLIETDAAEFNVGSLSSHDCDLLFAEALRFYGVLFASEFSQGMVDFTAMWDEVEKALPIHELLLEASNKDMRIAAGENIALMFEAVYVFTKKDEDEEALVDAPEYDNMDDLMHTLRGLSIDSSRQKSKSDRAEQKSVFRDILRTVEENEKPVEEVKIGHAKINFRGWAKILGIDLFRRCLGQGFQFHLKNNDMLKSTFHYRYSNSLYPEDDDDDTVVTELSNVDRKYLFEENKKSRSRHIRAARSGKDSEAF